MLLPEGADVFRRRATDAGIALLEAANTEDERCRDLARRIDEVRAAVELNGRWENSYEWRIGTDGTEWMERVPGGFRAGADFNGRFRTDFETFGEAWEGVRVLSRLGMSLFYALNWTERVSTPDLEPEPGRPVAEAYLKGLAREAAGRPPSVDELRGSDWHADGPRSLSVVTTALPADWGYDDDPEGLYVVTVRSGSLVLECNCPTPERAHLFLGVFDALASDLLEILDWRPLE